MGLIVDSSVLIAGERRRESLIEILKNIRAIHGNVECAISVVTIVELTHGIYRAKTDTDRLRRRAFCDELRRDLVVHPVSVEIAEIAGQIEGEQASRGVAISFQDLLIGATAMQMGYAVLTLNARDFQKIPRLSVQPL